MKKIYSCLILVLMLIFPILMVISCSNDNTNSSSVPINPINPTTPTEPTDPTDPNGGEVPTKPEDLKLYNIFKKYIDNKIYLIDVSKQYIDYFVSDVVKHNQINEYSISVKSIGENKESFTLKFGNSDLELTFNCDSKVDAKNKYSNINEDLGKLDLSNDNEPLYNKLIKEYGVTNLIKEEDFKLDFLYNQTYKYRNGVTLDFDLSFKNSNNNWLSYYILDVKGSLKLKFELEKTIDVLLNEDINNTYGELTSADVYDYYVNKNEFKEIYKKYNIKRDGFTIVNNNNKEIKYSDGFEGTWITNKNNQNKYDLSKIDIKYVTNTNCKPDTNQEQWKYKLIQEISNKSDTSTNEVESQIEFTFDENKRTFLIKPIESINPLFNKFYNSYEGKIYGAIKIDDLNIDNYLGILSNNKLVVDRELVYKYIADTLSFYLNTDIKEEEITFEESDSDVVKNKQMTVTIVYRNPSHSSHDKDYYVGTKLFKYTWVNDDVRSDKKYDSFSYDSSKKVDKLIQLSSNSLDYLSVFKNSKDQVEYWFFKSKWYIYQSSKIVKTKCRH
ncbi:hypothetical protein SLITO_v1c06420 [Spiroplasma litorale]|uniref:Lipoprotein n=1 Tax=Spiroplasma litorale TaxID=216942 RepID=A0A0K1W276_9MOLU|nr:hypothetical protein [Spiroplasma litorale]AKX34271.1 hypothetical protein SLITO_v1c06420 [Spiroplasma litorale]